MFFRITGSPLAENIVSKGRKRLQRSPRLHEEEKEIENRKIESRPGSYEGEENGQSKGPVNKKSNMPRNREHETKCKINNSKKKNLLSHANIGGFLSPPSSCSESNISEVASSVARVPSVSSSRRDSSAYSDYEDSEEYLAYENIGNGIMCRIEMTEDAKESDSKDEEPFPLLRSSSFTEDRSHIK